MRGHRDLVAWQKAMDLAKQIYVLTNSFPKHEVYGPSSQRRRAAVSIPSNLAEGAARNGRREFSYFISTARGSLGEVETQIQLGIPEEATTKLLACVSDLGRFLTGLHNWSSGPRLIPDKQPETRNKKQL